MVSSISSSVSSWASTLFSQLDTSKKGYISESDLSSAFGSLSTSTSTSSSDSSSSASKLFSSLDSNNDGKVTQDELANTLQTLSDQLNSQYDASRMASAMGNGMPPPPPPTDSSEEDSGLTQDQLTSIASSTTDSNLASLMNNVASNFSAADTNGDGKVSRTEAMAYKESTDSTSSGSTTTSSSNSETLKRILELLQAYSSQQNTSTSSLSLTA